RNQIRRLPHARAARQRRGEAPDPHRARLDPQISGDRPGRRVAWRSPGLSRRRIVRRGPDGITKFNIVQLASDKGNAAALLFFLFDLLYLDGEDLRPRRLIEREERLRTLLANAARSLHYSDHLVGQ